MTQSRRQEPQERRHGNGEHDGVRLHTGSVAQDDRLDATRVEGERRHGGPRDDRAARPLERALRVRRVELRERDARHGEPRRARAGEEGLPQDGGERRRRRHLGGLIERRDRERMPEARARGGRLPGHRQRRGHRVLAEGCDGAGREADGADEQTEPIARRQQAIAQQRRGRLEGSRHARRHDGTEAERRIRERHVQPRLEGELRRRPDLAEEIERGGVGAHERVRPVVDDIAGGRIREGVGAAAEEGPPLEQRHPRAAAREADGRREAREAAAHHRDVRW